jgi:hypothetical protein
MAPVVLELSLETGDAIVNLEIQQQESPNSAISPKMLHLPLSRLFLSTTRV